MRAPRVFSKRSPHPPDAIYIGRPGPWGNPYPLRGEEDRDRVCDQFEAYAAQRLAADPLWLAPLRGRDLVCWCAPRRCHGSTLIRLANQG
jgi:hypothetical protein